MMWTALLLACGTASTAPPPQAPDGAERASDTVSSVEYRWTWAPAPASVTPRDDGGWVFHTDEGYTVELHAGQLVAYSVWLDPCPEQEVGLLDVLGGLASPFGQPAWAGHSVMSNPTASRQPVVEDLVDLGSQSLPTLSFEPGRFCRTGALFARGDNHTQPDGHAMSGTSIHLVGRWTKDGTTTDFDMKTTISHSAGAQLQPDGGGSHLSVDVRRSLDGLFDGIDFAATPEPRVLRGVLSNLVDHTTFVARRTDD